jgi:hypothetical protein
VLFGGVLALVSVWAVGFMGWVVAGSTMLMNQRQAAKAIKTTSQL